MATIYVDEKYGFNAQDSTIPFFEALVNESGKGNTVIFRNMGSPWNIGAQVRLFDFNDITVIFEPGCVVRKKLVSEGGYWQNPNIRRYKGITGLKRAYPNGVSGTDYYEPTNNQAGSLIAILRCNNAHFIAYGAEFIGVYPQDNPGKDPATTSNARDYSYEFGHMIMFSQPGNGSGKPCSWRGGWIHNFSGDGINVNDSFPGGDVIIEDVKVNYCKRLGIAHIHGQAFVEINDCDVSLNGKADINPVWGTNTRQGITIEPNKGNETVKARYRNLRLVGNSSCGLGLNMGKCDSTAPAPIEMYFEGLHLDGNSDQVDYSAASAIRWNGTDMYNTETGEVDGDNPLDGTVEFKDTVCWGDVEGFFYYRGYDGKPSIKLNNTVIYKPSTTGLQIMAGDAINEWVVGGGRFQPTHTLRNFNWGDVLCIHDKNEPFISLEIIGSVFNQVENTVTGNLTIASPHTGGVIRQKRGTLTDNNTITKKQYTLSNFPKNQVSVVGTKNAIKTTNQSGEFTFTRSGDTSFPMAIHYEVSTTGSNAEMMIDFKLLRGSVVIPKGQTSVTLPVVPLNVNRKGGDRVINLTITPKNDLYTIGTQSALVFLSDEAGVVVTPPPTGSLPEYTKEQWAAEFDLYWDNPNYDYSMETTSFVVDTQRGARKQAESGNYNQEYYFLSYQINGLIKVWQATGNTKYLNDVLELIHICIDKAVDVGGGYLGWPNAVNNGYPLWDSYLWRFVTTLLAIMKESPVLLTQPNETGGTYQDDYDEILTFTEQHIWNRYAGTTDTTTTGNLYRSRTHMASHWARIGADLFFITGKQKYKTVYDNIMFAGMPVGTAYTGDNIKNQMKDNIKTNTAWQWNQTWDITTPTGGTMQDMSHAGAVVSAIIRGYDLGYYWQYSDILRLYNTLDKVLLVGNNYQLYYDVDGTGGGGYAGLFTQKGRGHEWMEFGKFNQTLQNKIANNYVFGGPDNDYNLDYYATHVLGIMAYNQAYIDGTLQYPEQAPKVSNFKVETIETNRIVVSWNLSTGATGKTEYDTNSGSPYLNQTPEEKNYLTFHRQSIRNLQPNTTYYFRVTGQDNLGNVYVSEELSAKTLPDATQPKTIIASTVAPGYSSTNSTQTTECYYNAIRSANPGDTIIIDYVSGTDGVWNIEGRHDGSSNGRFDGANTSNNITIVVERGVTLSAVDGTYDDPSHLDILSRFDEIDGIHIKGYGAKIYMRGNDFTVGQFKSALAFYNCKNVTVEGLLIDGSGGDGVIIHDKYRAGALPGLKAGFNYWCENVVLKNLTILNQKRQGVSPLSVDGLKMINCKIEDQGAVYQDPNNAGLGFEPDFAGQRISNITINQTLISKSWYSGIFWALTKLNNTSTDVTNTFNDVYLVDNWQAPNDTILSAYDRYKACFKPGYGGGGTTESTVQGKIQANRLLIKNSPYNAISFVMHSGTIKREFNDLCIINPGQDSSETDSFAIRDVRYTLGTSIGAGGWSINGGFIKEPRNKSWLQFFGGGTDTYNIEDVTVNDVLVVTPYTGKFSNPDNRQLGTGVIIEGGYEQQTIMPSTTISVGVTTNFTKRGSSSPAQFTIRRNSVESYSLPVEYTLSGTAINGDDYDMLHGYAIIPANSDSITIDILARQQDIADSKSVVLTLSLTEDYQIGTSISGTVMIHSDDWIAPIEPKRNTTTATILVNS